ncbi:hypothetical protein C0992_007114 [Termitomyces sp. T32_za158]|nr:hypothetical protein C0992_007114 [Termitomyces sp. T32_za158]
MAPFSTHGGLPPVVSFSWKDDTVYFAETIMSQLLPYGSGFGTFDTETTDPSLKLRPLVTNDEGVDKVLPGSILRFPKWGIRIRCKKLPHPATNLVLWSNKNMTYVLTPRDVFVSLFRSFGMDLPESLMAPLNITAVLVPGDQLPTGLNTSEIALVGQDGKGWISIEEVLVRLNTTYTPNGTFARKSDQSLLDDEGNQTWIGYDAAICVELFEPWIVEVYNSTTGLPTTLKIVQPGNVVHSQDTPELQERLVGLPLYVTNPDVHNSLNSSKATDVYKNAHQNSVNQLLKDNGRDLWYAPSPTVISFSGGQGLYDYKELSPSYFAQARGLADAGNLLPYFAGTGEILTRRYQDLVLSSTSVNPGYMGIYIGLIMVLGILAGLFVPKLPLNVPHRGFEVDSWIAAFHADELIEIGGTHGNGIEIEKNLDLHEIIQQVGDIKFRLIT